VPRLIPPEVVNAIAEERRQETARVAAVRKLRRQRPNALWRTVETAAVGLEQAAEALDRTATAHGVPSQLHHSASPNRS
jgi:hypothetical protein